MYVRPKKKVSEERNLSDGQKRMFFRKEANVTDKKKVSEEKVYMIEIDGFFT